MRDARRLVEQREVGFDLPRRAGRCTLTATRLPFGSVARCTWPIEAAAIGCSSNSTNSLSIDRPSSSSIDLLDLRERERADVVLEAAQLGDDVGREHVGPRREQLAELDEGRAELVEHLAQVLAALRRLAVDLLPRPAAREEIGQPVGVEPVAEAVPDGDLGDLRQAAEVARGRLSHRFSVTDDSPASGTGRCRPYGPGRCQARDPAVRTRSSAWHQTGAQRRQG